LGLLKYLIYTDKVNIKISKGRKIYKKSYFDIVKKNSIILAEAILKKILIFILTRL